MNASEIIRYRLYNQRLSGARFTTPHEVVSWLTAVQAQDYAGAKWALAQRMKEATDKAIEQAFSEGQILRTHMMRPTWHFVAPADIRWIQKLTSPRVKAVNAFMDRKLELDGTLFRRSQEAITKVLQGGKHLTREELASALEQAGIPNPNGQRLAYIVMHAELNCVICSGPRRGKQFTYALLEEHVPAAKELDHDEALAELTRRYFRTHGPATAHDFSWWSGLTLASIRRGLDILKSELSAEEIDGHTVWFSNADTAGLSWGHSAYLLPNYDEYGIAYKDHNLIFGSLNISDLRFAHTIIIKGQIVGTWRRALQKDSVLIECNTFKPLTRVNQRGIAEAAERYGQFLGLRPVLQYVD